jgi:hypothetical protein
LRLSSDWQGIIGPWKSPIIVIAIAIAVGFYEATKVSTHSCLIKRGLRGEPIDCVWASRRARLQGAINPDREGLKQ